MEHAALDTTTSPCDDVDATVGRGLGHHQAGAVGAGVGDLERGRVGRAASASTSATSSASPAARAASRSWSVRSAAPSPSSPHPATLAAASSSTATSATGPGAGRRIDMGAERTHRIGPATVHGDGPASARPPAPGRAAVHAGRPRAGTTCVAGRGAPGPAIRGGARSWSGLGIGLAVMVAAAGLAFSIVAIPLFFVASTEPGSGLDRDLVSKGLFYVALPFGAIAGLVGGPRGRDLVRPRRSASRHRPSVIGSVVGRVSRCRSRSCLLSFHAHPDDESSKGAGTVARYHAEGVRTVLVCCHRRRGGRHPQPGDGHRRGEGRHRRVSARQELDRAAEIIGYDEVVMLGYRDSGMPDSEANANPDCFAAADFDEAVGRLVADHPPHPPAGDPHLRRRAGLVPAPRPPPGARDHPARRRPGRRPGLVPRGGRAVAGREDLPLGLVAEALRGDAREVPRARPRVAVHRRPLAGPPDRRTTGSPRTSTSRGYAHVRLDALLAHATQIDPELAVLVRAAAGGGAWRSTRSTTSSGPSRWSMPPTPEDDLFAGVREQAWSST